MIDMIEDILGKYRGLVDYLEIRLEEFQVTDIAIRKTKVEVLREALELGGCCRAIYKGGIGFVSFTDLDRMESLVEQAVAQARSIGREKTHLASVEVIKATYQPTIKGDPRDVNLAKKLDILKAYNEIILASDNRIKVSSVHYHDEFKNLYFGNSEGTLITQARMDLGAGFTAIAVGNGETQYGHAGIGSSNDFNVIYGRESEIRQACADAVALLDAPSIKSGKYTVIADPKLAGTFAHEAFGHISEGDNVANNPNLLAIMKLGSVFGSPVLSIYDSGLDEGSRGFIKYDEEGTPSERTELIRNGILVGRLHSRETAGMLNEKPTGSARAIDYRCPPIPRMRNTCIQGGTSSFDEMIQDVKLGVYAIESMGGQAEETFTFTAARAYMIRDGKLAELVKNVTISGNLFTTLKNIDMVGNDFQQEESGGGCGKGDGWKFQFPLPVATGSPHIRIQETIIGGQ